MLLSRDLPYAKDIGDRHSLIRKVPHVIGGIYLAIFISLGIVWPATGLLAASVISYSALIIITRNRARTGKVTELASRFGIVGYDSETCRVHSYLSSPFSAFFAIGVLLILFPRYPALAGIIALTAGDTVAAFVGVRSKTHLPIPGSMKTFEGSSAMFLSTFALTFIATNTLLPSLVSSVVATIVEALPSPLDDNFLVPFLTAVVFLATLWVLA
jgi:dolichol kinase